uniref:Uncharacterized protein n=1 Tax=Arundo donax TaxID=35708 RepID=A0A0A9FIH4_ARUDO
MYTLACGAHPSLGQFILSPFSLSLSLSLSLPLSTWYRHRSRAGMCGDIGAAPRAGEEGVVGLCAASSSSALASASAAAVLRQADAVETGGSNGPAGARRAPAAAPKLRRSSSCGRRRPAGTRWRCSGGSRRAPVSECGGGRWRRADEPAGLGGKKSSR